MNMKVKHVITTTFSSLYSAISLIVACAVLWPRLAYASGERHCTTMNVPVTVAGVPDASIYGELCMPPATVQLLVHSTWYNHRYFDPPQEKYSYVRSAVAAGYATFNVDRLGTGRSTKPAPDLVTVETVEDTLHQVIVALRSGAIGGRAFSKVVWVGSSFGSAYGWVNGTRHPGDIDAYVLTGILHYTKPSFVKKALPFTTSACDDPVFAHLRLDCGYFTNQIGTKGELYYFELSAAPGMLEGVDDFVLRDVVSLPLALESVAKLGGILSSESPVVFTPMPTDTDFARGITVLTLVVIGDRDNIFCGPPDGLICTVDNLKAFESPYYGVIPDIYIAPDSGHATALQRSGPATAAVMLSWLADRVGAN